MSIQTVVMAEEKKTVMVLPSGLGDTFLQFLIHGQTVERSYEDRDVYIEISNAATPSDVDVRGWLKGEDAIKLGQALISQGLFALDACRINHQHIHELNRLKRWIDEGLVERLTFTVIDKHPANYGDGYRTFRITPTWAQGKAALFYSDFELDHVTYWSPFEEDYQKQLQWWTVPIEFVGYNYDEEVKRWRAQFPMNTPHTEPKEAE